VKLRAPSLSELPALCRLGLLLTFDAAVIEIREAVSQLGGGFQPASGVAAFSMTLPIT